MAVAVVVASCIVVVAIVVVVVVVVGCCSRDCYDCIVMAVVMVERQDVVKSIVSFGDASTQ
eukprot:8278003-Karenia_brevis.AAC.1